VSRVVQQSNKHICQLDRIPGFVKLDREPFFCHQLAAIGMSETTIGTPKELDRCTMPLELADELHGIKATVLL